MYQLRVPPCCSASVTLRREHLACATVELALGACFVVKLA